MSKQRAGVFFCLCGGRIGDVLDTQALADEVATWAGVAVARVLPFSCSPVGLQTIASEWHARGLTGVVIAGCSPRLMGSHLRQAWARMDLPAGSIELVDLREGCAGAHAADREGAQAKALDLVRMGLERCGAEPANCGVEAPIHPGALVIGGGLAGITACLTLAQADVPVTLVERRAHLGGTLLSAHTLYPCGTCAAGLVAQRVAELEAEPGVRILRAHTLRSLEGAPGRRIATIEPVEANGQGPLKVECGAVIVATGARVVSCELPGADPRRVLSQVELEAALRRWEHSSAAASADILPTGPVVMLPCALEVDCRRCGGHGLRVAIKQAMELRTASPETAVTIIHARRCLRPTEAASYAAASKAGIDLVAAQVRKATPSQVILSRNSSMDDAVPYGCLIVPSLPAPQSDAAAVARLAGLDQDPDGYLVHTRRRLRPADAIPQGVYLCGAAHGPVDWQTAELQAASAALAAYRYLQMDKLQRSQPVPVVDAAVCSGCAACVGACTLGAIQLVPTAGVLALASIDPLLCAVCGSCAAACPTKAITMPRDTVLAQIRAALSGPRPADQVRIVAFGCEWSGQAAAELAGARSIDYPAQVRLVGLRCAAQCDPVHILWALHCGADGVFVGACPPAECHYAGGSGVARERLEQLRDLLARAGLDARRLRLEWLRCDNASAFAARIGEFTRLVQALGPLRRDEYTPAGQGAPAGAQCEALATG
ncbi:MAG: hydrogenase iron-sulfur subunit [Anaerolineae bacterium]